jgi:hypothetical protein
MLYHWHFISKLIGLVLLEAATSDNVSNNRIEGRLIVSEHEMFLVKEGVDRAVAGYRSAFGSFYAHIYLSGDGSGWPCPSLEIGDDFDEITDPRLIIEFVEEFATVPDGFAETLRADAEKEGKADLPALLAVQQPRPAVYDLDESEIPF